MGCGGVGGGEGRAGDGGGGAGRETAGSGPRYPSSGHRSPRASLPSAASWEFALHPWCVACGQQQGLISTWVIVFAHILGVVVPCGARGRQAATEAAAAEPQASQAEAAARTETGRTLAKDTQHLPLVLLLRLEAAFHASGRPQGSRRCAQVTTIGLTVRRSGMESEGGRHPWSVGCP